MKRNIYGAKMLVVDLILVSVWAILFSRCVSPGILLLIPIRVALSFEMHRMSPWTLVSAIGFMMAYLCCGHWTYPFEKMAFGFFNVVLDPDSLSQIYSQPLEWEMKVWINSFAIIGLLWMAVMPVVMGIRYRNLREIKWSRKWIWLYLVPFLAISIWATLKESEVGIILMGLVIAVLPAVYWSIYERHGRSVVQLLLQNKAIVWYGQYSALMLSVFTIGMEDINTLKWFGLMLFPPLFYIMLMRSMHLGTALTRCCVALAVSGKLYWMTLCVGKTWTIALLIAAVGLVVYSAIETGIRTKTWKAPVILAIALPTVIIPFTLGLNPYVVTEADDLHKSVSGLTVGRGMYIVEKDTWTPDSLPLCGDCRKYGIRDRYGLILPIEYGELKALDRRGRFVRTNSVATWNYQGSDNRYGVFDTYKRVFVINPKDMAVTDLEMIGEKSYLLYGANGQPFATLYLPGLYDGRYNPETRIEPYTADAPVHKLLK